MRLEEYLYLQAIVRPSKTAVICGDLRLTYRELCEKSLRFANCLRERGVQRGDRVVIVLENSIESVIAIFGSATSGAVFSVVHPTIKSDKLQYILKDCGAAAIVAHAGSDHAKTAAAQSGVRAAFLVGDIDQHENDAWSFEAASSDASAKVVANAGIDIDLAMIVYTSGSTGGPKGVMMTHANIHAAASSITAYLQNTPDDIIMCVLPMSFDYGLYQIIMTMKVGATVVIEKGFTYPFAVLEKARAEKVTGLPLVPTMAAVLLQLKDRESASLPTLRYITNTAAALPPAHIDRLRDMYPHARIFSMYGVTECKRCTYLPPEQLDRRPDSVGIPIPNTEAYVAGPNGERLPPGEVGVLVVRGAHVMKGYWGNEEATNKALRTGRYPWERELWTGDLFRSDEEGYLYFVARTDDVIKSRGEKVSPREIENVLYGLSGIQDAVVVGVPDPVLGMAIKAVIVQTNGSQLTARDVRAHCSRHLEDFMVPTLVEFRDSLPKSDNGKLLRRAVT